LPPRRGPGSIESRLTRLLNGIDVRHRIGRCGERLIGRRRAGCPKLLGQRRLNAGHRRNQMRLQHIDLLHMVVTRDLDRVGCASRGCRDLCFSLAAVAA
jgi:hypothetical protein